MMTTPRVTEISIAMAPVEPIRSSTTPPSVRRRAPAGRARGPRAPDRARPSSHTSESGSLAEAMSGFFSRGFTGRRRLPGELADRLPPGQYYEPGFPVLTAGPTPRVDWNAWTFEIDGLVARPRTWTSTESPLCLSRPSLAISTV